jgi:hypothetical protein
MGGLTGGITDRARQQAYALLGPVHEDTPEEMPVRQLLARLPTRAPDRPNIVERIFDRALDLIEELVARRWMAGFAVVSLCVQSLVTLSGSLAGAVRTLTGHPIAGAGAAPLIGAAVGGLAAAALTGRGGFLLTRSRLRAFQAFRLAVLANVMLTDVFYFDLIQFAAVFELGYDLLLLGAISAEARRLRRSQAPVPRRAFQPDPAG